MSEWRLVWQVTIKYADPKGRDRGEQQMVRVETAAELRRLVEWARANPSVVGFPYQRVRERYGGDPERCQRGHEYSGGSATRVRVGWSDCICGGHYAYVCRTPECTDVRVDPPVYDDCDVTEAALVQRSVHLRHR